MIQDGIHAFQGKRILLLQGPIGPFFRRLSHDLQSAGATVTKINFNGGDAVFSPRGAIVFRGSIADWPAFLEKKLLERRIDIVMLFGDCRPIHVAAQMVTKKLGISVGVFEEGYVRPDFITLEKMGVNAYSSIPRDPQFFRNLPNFNDAAAVPVGNTYWWAVQWAMLYYFASFLAYPLFKKYKHHRSLSILEALPWLRSFWRKHYWAYKERGIETRLSTDLSRQFFLGVLQVYNDSQVSTHSDFDSVAQFISVIIRSFAQSAPDDTLLVIKQHPYDRGHHDYSALIEQEKMNHQVQGRAIYIHDQHLPSLLANARGVVTINSTVGLSALHHGTAVKVCGDALYDMSGLTFQGPLDQFWDDSNTCHVDRELYRQFKSYLIRQTQLNGSFYRRLHLNDSATGLIWETLKEVAPEIRSVG